MVLAQDLGNKNDYTTSILIRETPEALRRFDGDTSAAAFFDVLELDRVRGVPYPEIIETTRRFFARPEIKDACDHIVDATGVGVAVVQSMRAAGLRPVGCTITGASVVSRDEALSGYRVPKRTLYQSTDLVLQSRRLRIANPLPFREQLRAEMEGFKARMTLEGHDSYENASAGLHDDLVMALCMGLWYLTRGGLRTTEMADEEHGSTRTGDSTADWDPFDF